jgi:hypothetical protein
MTRHTSWCRGVFAHFLRRSQMQSFFPQLHLCFTEETHTWSRFTTQHQRGQALDSITVFFLFCIVPCSLTKEARKDGQ